MALPILERMISIPEAVAAFGLSESHLYDLIQEGNLRGVILSGGEIYVSAEITAATLLNARLKELKRSQFDHLADSQITSADAEKRYCIPVRTIREWAQNQYIRTCGTKPLRLNEADLAFCAAIYRERKKGGCPSGMPLLDSDGNPYLIKRPDISDFRRKAKPSHFEN